MNRWSTPGEASAYETGYIEGMADAKQWIPVTERLPNPFEGVLITVKERWNDTDKWEYHTDVGSFCVDGEWETYNDWNEGQDLHIVAWMPLPKPYEKENL